MNYNRKLHKLAETRQKMTQQKKTTLDARFANH